MALPKVAAIALSQLKSKFIDEQILFSEIKQKYKSLSVNGKNGILGALGKAKDDNGGGIIGFLKGLAKTLMPVLGLFSWSFQTIAQSIVNVSGYLWNFNWNITNKEIEQIEQSYRTQLAGQLGGLLGQAVGYTVCGVGASAAIGVFSPTAARYALSRVGEEAFEDTLASLYGLFSSAASSALEVAWLRAWQSSRNLIKLQQRGFATALNKVYPGSINWDLYNEQENSKRHWSFARALEEKINTIQSPEAQAFAEEFFEELGDGCQEAIIIIGGALDSYISSKQATESVLGPDTVVQVTPNREYEKQTVYLFGPTQLVKPAITQAITNSQLLEQQNQVIPAGFMRKYTFIPQLQVIYRGQSGHKSQYSLTIPHWNKKVNASENIVFPSFDKGEWCIVVTLDDNSKFICNASSKSECQRIWNFAKSHIDNDVLRYPQVTIYEDTTYRGYKGLVTPYRAILKNKEKLVAGQWITKRD